MNSSPDGAKENDRAANRMEIEKIAGLALTHSLLPLCDSVALSGLGGLWTVDPGRRSRTRFALGYYLSGFQPFRVLSAELNFIRRVGRAFKVFCPNGANGGLDCVRVLATIAHSNEDHRHHSHFLPFGRRPDSRRLS